VSDWLLLVKASCDWLAYWLLEVSWTCLCFLLLNFSSCSVDAFPVKCVSYHVCFWSRALRVHGCALANSHMIFVDIFQMFRKGDLRLLSLGNSLSVSVVIATGWQTIFIGCSFSSLLSDLLASP